MSHFSCISLNLFLPISVKDKQNFSYWLFDGVHLSVWHLHWTNSFQWKLLKHLDVISLLIGHTCLRSVMFAWLFLTPLPSSYVFGLNALSPASPLLWSNQSRRRRGLCFHISCRHVLFLKTEDPGYTGTGRLCLLLLRRNLCVQDCGSVVKNHSLRCEHSFPSLTKVYI